VDVPGIEAALLGTGLVREAVVLVRTRTTGDARVIAYLVPRGDADFNVTTVRRRLAAVVPPQSLPSRFVVLERLPTTASHKIDRDALPAPDTTRPRLEAPFVAARSDLETSIAAVWAETLGLDQVGIADDFFDLGGDSLDAMAVLSRLSTALGADLRALTVFEHPTVERFAVAVDAILHGSERAPAPTRSPGSALVRVQPSGSRVPFFFLHAEYGGDGSYCLNLARHLGGDQPFLGLSPFGRDGEAVPCRIEEMAAGYLEIVRAEQPDGPYSIGGFCSGAVVAWEMAHQLRRQGLEVALLVLIEPPPVESGRVARALHAAVGIASWLGVSHEARVDVLQRAMRLARLRSLPMTAATVRRLPRLIARALRLDTSVEDDRQSAIARVYRRAVEAYLPRRFDGPVLCLKASDAADDHSLREWRRLSANFASRQVPGDHNSCIIRHAQALGHALGSRLSAIAAGPPMPAHCAPGIAFRARRVTPRRRLRTSS
jgi:thioesterase domain-containing protein/acyl carrier protein